MEIINQRKICPKRKEMEMSVRKYRMILLTALLIVVAVGVVAVFYYSQQEKKHQDGTLVQSVYVLDEVAA